MPSQKTFQTCGVSCCWEQFFVIVCILIYKWDALQSEGEGKVKEEFHFHINKLLKFEIKSLTYRIDKIDLIYHAKKIPTK